MSLFPSIVTLLLVMMLAVSSARVAQDAGLSAAQRIDSHLARQRGERALRRIAKTLASDEALPEDVLIEQVPVSAEAELGDLPLLLQRVTVVGHGHQAMVRLQADFAVDGCESADDDPCTPRVRIVALRELPE